MRNIHDGKNLDILAQCEIKRVGLSSTNSSRTLASWVPNWSIPKVAEPLYDMKAGASTLCRAQHLGNGVLQVEGVHAATVEVVKKLDQNVFSSYDQISWWIKEQLTR